MRRALLGVIGLAAALAAAQDRTELLRESNVQVERLELTFLPDAGCVIQAVGSGTTDAGTEERYTTAPRPWNYAICGQARTVALKQVKRAARVGDGSE